MATTDQRPYRYQGKITFDVPGVDTPIEAGFGSGGAGKGSTPYGDWPITQFNPHTPKYDLEGFALNNIYGRMPDPLYSDGRSDVMLHLDPKGRTLDKIKSLGCLSVDPKDWPALRDQIISLQKQGYSLVAHVDQSGQVTIRQADGTTATQVSSASAFADATKAARAPIKDLQTSLAKAGFDPGKVDGIQGPRTTAAVKAFQQANGLQVDGIVGPMTSAVLAASSKTPPPLPGIPQAASFGVRGTGKTAFPGSADFADAGLYAPGRGSGLGGLDDPRTAALLAPTRAPAAPTFQPGMTGRGLPAPTFQPGMMGRGLPPTAQPPVPMPGRPAALTGAPPAPVQAQPPQLPAQRPSAPVAPPQQLLRLPSGKPIAPGLYDQGDHSVMVSDGGDGIAKVERVRGPMSIPGVIDPLREANAPTIAGAMIRKMLPGQLAGNASNFVPAVTDNVKSAALGAASNLGNSIGGMFGGLFGGAPKPATWAPWGSIPALPQQRAPVPMSRPLFAQPQVAAPRVPAPVQVAPSVAARQAADRQQGLADTLSRISAQSSFYR